MTTPLPTGTPNPGPVEKLPRLDGWVWGFTGLFVLLHMAVIRTGDLELRLIDVAGLSCCCLPCVAITPCLLLLTRLRMSWYTAAGVGLIFIALWCTTFNHLILELCAAC